MTAKYSRVLVVLFDLDLDKFTDDNKLISQFREVLLARLMKQHKLNEIGFSWCRELEQAKQQH